MFDNSPCMRAINAFRHASAAQSVMHIVRFKNSQIRCDHFRSLKYYESAGLNSSQFTLRNLRINRNV